MQRIRDVVQHKRLKTKLKLPRQNETRLIIKFVRVDIVQAPVHAVLHVELVGTTRRVETMEQGLRHTELSAMTIQYAAVDTTQANITGICMIC